MVRTQRVALPFSVLAQNRCWPCSCEHLFSPSHSLSLRLPLFLPCFIVPHNFSLSLPFIKHYISTLQMCWFNWTPPTDNIAAVTTCQALASWLWPTLHLARAKMDAQFALFMSFLCVPLMCFYITYVKFCWHWEFIWLEMLKKRGGKRPGLCKFKSYQTALPFLLSWELEDGFSGEFSGLHLTVRWALLLKELWFHLGYQSPAFKWVGVRTEAHFKVQMQICHCIATTGRE